jgi:glycosyltransferase involved in cell wall biosynthesis
VTAPTVSVVIPNYNHARELPRCLDALLRQSQQPTEIIVIDDASEDDSLQVLEGYSRRSPVVRVHRNERNLGVVPNMNRGLQMARGNYVTFQGADDEALPGWFEKLLPMVRDYPGAGFASGLSEWHCLDTALHWVHGTSMPAQAGYIAPEAMIDLAKAGRLAMSGQHALYRRAALIEAGGWIPELRWYTDWFGAWVVGFRYGVCHVPEVLSVYNLTRHSYYHREVEKRRQTMEHLLTLLESDAYRDVEPRLRASGLLGGFGPLMVGLVLRKRQHHRFANRAFFRHASRRSAEIIGRRFFPAWLARACVRIFYSRH